MLPIKGTFKTFAKRGEKLRCNGLLVDLWNGEARIFGLKVGLGRTLDGESCDEEAEAVGRLCCCSGPRNLGDILDRLAS